MISVLLFRIAEHLCGMRVEVVQEVVHIAATVHIPGQPPLLEGFLNLRGRHVPVLPLARLFGLPAGSPGLYAPVLIAGMGTFPAGLLATAVHGVVTVNEVQIHQFSADESLNACAEGQFDSEYGTVTLLSIEKLLLEKETRCIAELTERANARLAELDDPAA